MAILLTLLVTQGTALAQPASRPVEQPESSQEPESMPLYSAPTLPLEEPEAPWRPRLIRRNKHMPARGMALRDLKRWPMEPASPEKVRMARFAHALRRLCPKLYKRRSLRYTKWILGTGRKFEVDPFLLAALAYRSSRCNPLMRRGHRGGLITLQWRPHTRYIRRRTYHYWEFQDGVWVPRVLLLKRYPFRTYTLRRSYPSLYFAAALLSIYKRQCPAIDTRFGSVPHRHPVSHLIWGDRVVDAGSEDRILLARRRLLEYYSRKPPVPVGTLEDMPLYSPLDGVPRKVSSGLGDIRGGGHHAHRGLDFESTRGEPVRAIADGVVFKAGVDLPRSGSRSLHPKRSRWYRRSRMGRGGLFVMIRHRPGLVSAYMHLESFVVADGDRVKGGQLIGFVGRSGIKRDPAHLHFELRKNYRAMDPIPLLGASVFPPTSHYRGKLIKDNQPRMWRRARYRRWMRRKRALARRRKARARRRRRHRRRRARLKKKKQVKKSASLSK
jgi:hypothetical protein